MIEKWLGPVFRWVEFIGPNPFLQAAVIILAFLVLGKLVDWVTRAALDRVLIRWDSGGRLGGIGHRTVFRTIALLGLLVATEVLPMTPLLMRLTTALVLSLLILVWVSATIRAGYLVGALKKGAEGTDGIHATLVQRVEAAATNNLDEAQRAEYERGLEAGSDEG